MGGVDHAPQAVATTQLDRLRGAQLEMDPLRRVVPTHVGIEGAERSVHAVHPTLREDRARGHEDDRLPGPRNGGGSTGPGGWAGDRDDLGRRARREDMAIEIRDPHRAPGHGERRGRCDDQS
jgi:hypothetical protein